MTERPIIFSGPMVRAILEGRKTQTRRVMKPQPSSECAPIEVCTYPPTKVDRHGEEYPGAPIFGATSEDGYEGWRSPFGQPGDTIWVRETFSMSPDGPVYRASESDAGMLEPGDSIVWKPSIHMPRAIARLFLRVTAVRVERLQDISAEDVKAEGLPIHVVEHTFRKCYRDDDERAARRIECFRDLWDGLNATRGYGWDSNPWVWVVSFDRLTSENGSE